MWRRFWRGFVLFFAGGIVGAGLGFAAGIFAFPYIFLADITADEDVVDREHRVVLAHASFIHADPSDPAHYGRGKATLFVDLVHLEPDFEVGPGPRYHVYLSPEAEIVRSSDFFEERSVDLGRLKAFRGAQSYRIPDGVDPTRYRSVVIWCKAFNVLISPAPLKFADRGR